MNFRGSIHSTRNVKWVSRAVASTPSQLSTRRSSKRRCARTRSELSLASNRCSVGGVQSAAVKIENISGTLVLCWVNSQLGNGLFNKSRHKNQLKL